MKTFNMIILSCVLVFLTTSHLNAIDGYRGFKWGMTKKQVLNLTNDSNDSFCDFKDLGIDSDGINTLECVDFPFGKQKRYGFFLLVADELLRIGVSIDPKDVGLLVKIFDEEFGTTKKRTSAPLLKQGTLKWDNDTILLKLAPIETEDKKAEVIATLIYTSKNFEEKLKQLKFKQLEEAAIGK